MIFIDQINEYKKGRSNPDLTMHKIFNRSALRIHLMQAIKIGFGSALAIFICAGLNLPTPASAGTITLLTLSAGTRKETVRLILRRWISFILTVAICIVLMPFIRETYLAYALFLIIEVFILEILGWQSTLSVNAVIGVYFLINQDFTWIGILNECGLLLVSISISLILNLIQPDISDRQRLDLRIHEIEKEIQQVLEDAKGLLQNEQIEDPYVEKLKALEAALPQDINQAVRYEQNSFDPSDQWFARYFETRLSQCVVLSNLFGHIEIAQKDKTHIEVTANFIDVVIKTLPKSERPDQELENARLLRARVLSDEVSDKNLEERTALLDVIQNLQTFLALKQDFIDRLEPETQEGWYRCKKMN